MILQNKKHRYEKHKVKLNKKRERFLRTTDLVSTHERRILRDHSWKELRIIHEKKCEKVGQQNAKITASEATQTPATSLPLLQGCTHGSSAAGLSDEKVRVGMCSDDIISSVITCVLCANASAHVAQWEASQLCMHCILHYRISAPIDYCPCLHACAHLHSQVSIMHPCTIWLYVPTCGPPSC